MPKKKTFTQDNPALAFITTGAEDQPQERDTAPESQEPPTIRRAGTEPRTVTLQYTQPEQPPKGYKRDPRFIETRNKRYNALMQPSLFERIKAAAEAAGLSVNDLIHQTLEAAFPEKDGEREDSQK